MKRRPGDIEGQEDVLDTLAVAINGLRGSDEVRAFLEDLCTPAELESMTDRWRVVPLLQEGIPYREIHERTQVSVTTIGRVARTLDRGAGGYDLAVRRSRGRTG
ncbi:MAG: YerC/YecD family TrpR-related protein [Lysobacter sp.]